MHQTISTKSDSAAHPMTRDRTFHLDGTVTDMFNHPVPSAGADLQAENHTSDRWVNDGFVRLFHHSPWSGSSTPPLENVSSATGDEDMPSTPKRCSLVPRYTIVLPDESDGEAATRDMLKKEQQIEDTFRIQWQKMLKQRKAAMRTIRSWDRKRKSRYDTSGTDDDGMKVEIEEPSTDMAMSTGEPGRKKGKPANVKPCRRPLGPCGTIIIEDPYKRGDRTSPPPVYPSEWVARRLAGRESTESI